MKEYIILGESIVISDAEENYRQIVQISNEYVKNSKSKFEVWFDRQGNCATLLKNEDMDYMGPVRLKDVEEAQQKIVNIIRKLEDQGDIVIARAGEDEMVV